MVKWQSRQYTGAKCFSTLNIAGEGESTIKQCGNATIKLSHKYPGDFFPTHHNPGRNLLRNHSEL